ncbi:MAG TPA: PilZ domain-containing protein [bacterium (Candidatus Stahlbacteria)]|nr:PilZ domain-containing protein [Candidatus Stahlbacteria bacterium]
MPEQKRFSGKRRSERVRTLNFVDITQYDKLGYPVYGTVARSIDLSKEGMRIECPDDFPVGADLELEIALKDEFVSLNGRVVWKKKTDDLYQYGLEFTKVPDDKTDTLKKFIEVWKNLKIDLL